MRCGASRIAEKRAPRANFGDVSRVDIACQMACETSIPIPIGNAGLVLCQARGTTRSAGMSGREFSAPNQSHSPMTSMTSLKVEGMPTFALIVMIRDRAETFSARSGRSSVIA